MFFNRFVVFAHRGASGSVLENTAEAFRLACQQDADAVEFDVMLTKDGVPVVFHDESLERLAGVKKRVDEIDFADLRKIALKSVYAIPSFEEVLDILKTYYMPMNIEIKPSRKETQTERATANAVLATLAKKGMLQRANGKILVSSFSREALSVVGVVAPHLEKAVLSESLTPQDLAFARRIKAVSVHLLASKITKEAVSAAQSHGLTVCAYTVNDPLLARKFAANGIGGIFADNFQAVQRAVRGG